MFEAELIDVKSRQVVRAIRTKSKDFLTLTLGEWEKLEGYSIHITKENVLENAKDCKN